MGVDAGSIEIRRSDIELIESGKARAVVVDTVPRASASIFLYEGDRLALTSGVMKVSVELTAVVDLVHSPGFSLVHFTVVAE